LSAKLKPVVVPFSLAAPFVLHWVELAGPLLHDIGVADEPEAVGIDLNVPKLEKLAPLGVHPLVSPLVEEFALYRVRIGKELSGDVHKPAAPGAVVILIEGRDGDEVQLFIHLILRVIPMPWVVLRPVPA
jgi:hypothetical protein